MIVFIFELVGERSRGRAPVSPSHDGFDFGGSWSTEDDVDGAAGLLLVMYGLRGAEGSGIVGDVCRDALAIRARNTRSQLVLT